ncbi:MAG: hypothetical protein GXP22_06585 [Gammaproteobacteria bacterium]|nr:hypothetical protein [Gammaproteobacteria bacterium]
MLAIGKLIIHYTLAMILVSIPVAGASVDDHYKAHDLQHPALALDHSYDRDEMAIKGLCQGDDASQCCCVIDIPSIVQNKPVVLDDLFISRFVPYYPDRHIEYISTRLLRPPII